MEEKKNKQAIPDTFFPILIWWPITTNLGQQPDRAKLHTELPILYREMELPIMANGMLPVILFLAIQLLLQITGMEEYYHRVALHLSQV